MTKKEKSEIDVFCCECGIKTGIVKKGSRFRKGAGMICEKCQEKWQNLKNLLALYKAQGKNPQPDLSGLADLFGFGGTPPKK